MRDVLPLNGGSHQVREKVRCTGETGDFEGGEGGGVVVVEGGGAIVVEGEEGDDLDAAGDDVVHAFEHFFGIAAFVKVADEDEDGFLGLADEGLGVSEGEVDIGAAAELGAEEDVDGVGEFFAEVNDGGIEHNHFGADGRKAGEDSAEDAGKR